MPSGVRPDPAVAFERASDTWSVEWRPVLLASSSGLAGFWLAWHYPVGGWAMSAAFAAASVLFWAFPPAWLVAVPALLPVIGFAPWTGWITFEELDLLVLAVAAGGYARRGILRGHRNGTSALTPQSRGAGSLAALVIVLYAVSVLAALARGFDDAGGFQFGWYQGYYDAMNSVRLAKPLFLALLVWPLLREALQEPRQVGAALWSLGLALGLTGAALATVWERGAFTSLLDFSSDYRTTALFWEMHVGGAALDGFLALTVPFAVRELFTARTPWRWAVGATAVLLAGYACLTTFSRGVYLAVPVGVAALVWLQYARRRRLGPQATTVRRHGLLAAALLILGFCAGAAWLFPSSGYRGLLALFGATVVLLPLAAMLRGSTARQALLGIGLAVALSVIAVLTALSLPKGAYVAYVAAAAAAFGSAFWPRGADPRNAGAKTALALGTFVSVLTCLCLVCWRWGGEAGLHAAIPIAGALFAIALFTIGRKRAPWPDDVRWYGIVSSAMVVVASVVAIFDGGAYMGSRFSTSGQDFDGRVRHWREAFEGLRTWDEWLLGKGSGRFPASQLLVGADEGRPGDYRLVDSEGSRYLVLAGGKEEPGWGDLLRFSQRVPVPFGPVTFNLDARSERPVALHLELCEKHLIYGAGCMGTEVPVAPRAGQWQAISGVLKGDTLTGGAWYAPRLTVFALANASPGVRVDVRDLVLKDGQGRELLANGDFSQGLARWFFTSDRSHLPWHVKNLFLHQLFEQGVAGVALLSMLIAGSLWRLTIGHARDHPLAPATAAALIGFVLVGAFDSLIDVPRIAFLFYVLLLSGLGLRVSRVAAAR